MGFEGKHKFFKSLCGSLKNYKHICKTLTQRHQECYTNFSSEMSQSFGPTKCLDVESYKYRDLLMDKFGPFDEDPLYCHKWLHSGYHYKINYFCCTSTREELPVFNKILNIITVTSQMVFITQVYSTDYFCETRQAFAISEKDEKDVVLLSSLKYKETFDAVISCSPDDSTLYIIPKYIFYTVYMNHSMSKSIKIYFYIPDIDQYFVFRNKYIFIFILKW